MTRWKNDHPKPIVGIAGGIGAGKSLVARQFEGEGFLRVDADAIAHDVLQSDEVKRELRAWLGDGVFRPDGSVSRRAVAARVFGGPAEVGRLNGLIHPRVAAVRKKLTAEAMGDPAVRGVLWDVPLLFEIGLAGECDAVVFVDTPREVRLERLAASRGWTEEELDRREKLQFALDKKALAADYCIDNGGPEAHSLAQVQRILSQLLSKSERTSGP